MKRPIDHTRFDLKSSFNQQISHALQMAKNRLMITGVVFSFALLMVCGRLVDLMLFRQEPLTTNEFSPSFLNRSEILDCHGQVLATTLVTSSLCVNGKKIFDPEDTVIKLKTVFPHLSEKDLLKKIQEKKTFIWIQRHLTPHQQQAVIELGLPGVEFIRDHRRIYPQEALFSHVLGYTDIDNNGIAGLEKSMDVDLKRGDAPLVLSLDLRLQHVMRDELIKGMDEFGCIGSSGILMDVDTGHVLAMVSLPDFNPNKIDRIHQDQRFNKNTSGVYEMGSIMKIANTAMALESGVVQLHSTFNTSEPLKVGRFNITDYRANYGTINVADIFIHSSNKGAARMALMAGTDKQKAFLNKLGYLSPTTIELPEVSSPMVPKRWRDATAITVSYGYGLALSPLQTLAGITSIIGGGYKVKPTLLKEAPILKNERIVSAKVSNQILQLMRYVVTHGTSKRANIPGYFVAGKTGTANLLLRGTYNKARVTTTFIGILGEEATKPKYALFVRLDDPQRLKKTFGFNAAGWNAAPVSKRILERVAHVVGLIPKNNPDTVLDPFFQSANFKYQPNKCKE